MEEMDVVKSLKKVLCRVFEERLDRENWDIVNRKGEESKEFGCRYKEKGVRKIEVGRGWMYVVIDGGMEVKEMNKIWEKLNIGEDEVWKVGVVSDVEVGVGGLCCCWSGKDERIYGGFGIDVSDVGYYGKKGDKWIEIKEILGKEWISGLMS